MMLDLTAYRSRLRCNVPRVDDIFAGCMAEASRVFTAEGLDAYLDGASAVCGLGRGQELVLLFLENLPETARHTGEPVIGDVVQLAQLLSRTANAKAIGPFLARLPACARRLEALELMRDYFQLLERMAREAGEGLVPLLNQVDYLLGEICVGGLKNWIEEGLKGYRREPWRYGDWVSLQTADSRAALMRERHGTLYVDRERELAQYLKAFWDMETECRPYSLAFDLTRRPSPHLDSKGFHIPDVYDDEHGVSGIDRYRATLAHMAAHRTWTQPFIADNLNHFQHLFIEAFEDARVEYLAMQRYPGLRRLFQALHPIPGEDDCPDGWSCIRHHMALLSRALLDPAGHPYASPVLREYVARFHARAAADPHDVAIATDLGIAYLRAIHVPAFRLPRIFFANTEVGYRDDNRYMWVFMEDTDDDDDFHSEHAAANPCDEDDGQQQFVRHLKEWDHNEKRYKPDWVTLYESVQPPGDPRVIDALLEKHVRLAKQLRRIVDLLKPQEHVRIRYQEDGDELDLDVAIRALCDHRSGSAPDPRVHMSHAHAGRDIGVMLLLDLSQSINETPPGGDSSILQLSQEAVSLLADAVDALGDPFAIAGFASNTRHEVRYLHFKGYSEGWDDEVKGRLAAMQGGLSTRMGAALRNAGFYLSRRPNAKKLLLLLSDGEPHDVDVADAEYLRQDTRRAVEELDALGIYTFCITLDPKADDYVAELFGPNRYAVIDRIERLPERLPQLFMRLTR